MAAGSKKLNFTIPPDLYTKLDDAAREAGVTVHELVREDMNRRALGHPIYLHAAQKLAEREVAKALAKRGRAKPASKASPKKKRAS